MTSSESNILHADAKRPFRVLQLTDLHDDVSDALTEQTYADIRRLLKTWSPDFLAVTGDIWCGDDKPDRGPNLMKRDLEFLSSLKTPWAFTWGNHDYKSDLETDTARIASTPYACMEFGDGRGNCRVEIRHDGGPAWDIYFLNSHGECLWPDDLDWLESEAVRIREDRGTAVPAIAFFHIPLQQYETARLSGKVCGIALEDALSWGNSADRFDPIRRVGAIRACFVGHSHVNDFHFEKDGIVLAYGRATGHGGYGADRLRKGAKLIELNLDSDGFTFQTVFPDGSTWNPNDIM